MAGPPRGKVTVDIEECKGCGLRVESCPPKCLKLAVELNFIVTRRATPGRIVRLWNLFLLLPGTGRDYGLPHEVPTKGVDISARRRTCGSSVRETWR